MPFPITISLLELFIASWKRFPFENVVEVRRLQSRSCPIVYPLYICIHRDEIHNKVLSFVNIFQLYIHTLYRRLPKASKLSRNLSQPFLGPWRRLQRPYKIIFWNKCLFRDDIVSFSCFEAFEYLSSMEAFEYFRSRHNVPAVSNYEIPDAQEMLTQMEMWANVLCLLVWWGSSKFKLNLFFPQNYEKSHIFHSTLPKLGGLKQSYFFGEGSVRFNMKKKMRIYVRQAAPVW